MKGDPIRARKPAPCKPGILRGWTLPEEELARLAALDEPEVVLRHRPLKLHIEQVDRMDTVVWGSSEILLSVELFGAGDRVSRA